MNGLQAGTDGGRGPMPAALGWSVAVLLLGALMGVVVVPSAQGRSGEGATGLGTAGPGTASTEPAAAAGPELAPAAVAAAAPAPAPLTTTGADRPSTTSAPDSTARPGAAAAVKKAPTSTTRPSAAAAAPTSTAPAARLQPDAGSYPLAIAGSGSVDGRRTSVPGSGSLLVQQSSASDQTHRIDGLPGNLVLVQRATASGLDLVSFSLTAANRTITFRPSSPLAFVRTDAPVGTSWSWSVTSTDGRVSLNQRSTVTSVGPANVGGSSVPAVTVTRVFTASGPDVEGTLQLDSTVSLADRLPLVQRQALNIRAKALGGLLSTQIVSNITTTLTSTRPR